MDVSDVLVDGFDRVREEVIGVVEGMDVADLHRPVLPGTNPVAWLVWHLTRVQDDHVSEAFGLEQAWAGGWAERLALDLPVQDTGYGHSAEQVAAVTIAEPAELVQYHVAVHDRTVRCLRGLSPSDLDRVVDEAWDPPVTLGVRLVSVLSDDLQHVGQAGYVRGLLASSGDAGAGPAE